jgi:ABC-2 type transport system ATP-binding protein
VIQVESLTKHYGPSRGVEDLNFTINKGEIVGFLGPNGAGKSTTMRMLTGAMPPSSGSVTIDGLDIFKKPLEVKKNVGYLPESPPLYLDMPVRAYLTFVAKLKGLDRKKIKTAVDDAMARTHVDGVANRLIQNLSKGYRQRIGLAQAIIHNPAFLVLDEPTSGLDPKQIIDIRDLIRSFASDHTVILSSHILPEVSATCQRVMIINEGKIVADDEISKIQGGRGVVSSILLRVGGHHLGLQEKFNSVPGVETVRGEIDGSDSLFTIHAVKGEDPRPGLAKAVVQGAEGELLELRTSASASLEDVFLKLTTDEKLIEGEIQ